MNQDSYSPCNSPHPPPWNSKRSPWSPKPSNLILPSDKKEVEEDPIALAKMKINSLEKWKNRPKNKSKDSVQPMNEHEGHTDTLTKENLGSLFISSNNQEKNEKLERDFAIAGSVSFLSGETLRWMNSHLPFDNSYDRTRISPSFAFQLRKIFNGLDFNNSGEIDLDEMKKAIDFVSERNSKVIHNPKKMKEIFEKMDINKDGTLDFNEFVIGMSSDMLQRKERCTSSFSKPSYKNPNSNNSDEASSLEDIVILQKLFLSFSTEQKRDYILSILNNNASTCQSPNSNLPSINQSSQPSTLANNYNNSDLKKYQELKKLFQLKYFQDDESEFLPTSIQGPPSASSSHQNSSLYIIKEKIKKENREIFTENFKKSKKLESSRSIIASKHIKSNREQKSSIIPPPFRSIVNNNNSKSKKSSSISNYVFTNSFIPSPPYNIKKRRPSSSPLYLSNTDSNDSFSNNNLSQTTYKNDIRRQVLNEVKDMKANSFVNKMKERVKESSLQTSNGIDNNKMFSVRQHILYLQSKK